MSVNSSSLNLSKQFRRSKKSWKKKKSEVVQKVLENFSFNLKSLSQKAYFAMYFRFIMWFLIKVKQLFRKFKWCKPTTCFHFLFLKFDRCRFCIDNGAMIAHAGALMFSSGQTTEWKDTFVTQRYGFVSFFQSFNG